MKNFSFLVLCFIGFSVGLIHSCKKDAGTSIFQGTPPDSIITASFIEEFKDVMALTTTTGWIKKNNSDNGSDYSYTAWGQGPAGIDKSGNPYGFAAYSYSSNRDEYAFSGYSYTTISSWLITPVLSVKNGDKISFYTRDDANGAYPMDRMQVLMNKSASTDIGSTPNSVGGFTITLFDINPTQAADSYPEHWTKYEYIFSGISGQVRTRIAFRHYVIDPTASVKGIGIDQFKFLIK